MEAEMAKWQAKKARMDEEMKQLETELEDLNAWIKEIDNMDEQQLKAYLKNRPENFKTTATIKKSAPKKKVCKPKNPKRILTMSAETKSRKEDD